MRRVRVFIFIRRGEFGSSGEESSGLHLHQERRVRVFNFIRRGEFESSSSSGEESSGLQERRVRVFIFTRRGEFGSSSSSGEESSGLQLHQGSRVRGINCFSGVREARQQELPTRPSGGNEWRVLLVAETSTPYQSSASLCGAPSAKRISSP